MANSYRAKSLTTLVNQLNSAYPSRSKVSDGWIGDASHQITVSDHNPLPNGAVLAQDITHDPDNGVDIVELADSIKDDPRTKYVIRNKEIYQDGKWSPYNGPNPHTKHLHLSVKANNYDNTADWQIGGNKMYPNKGDLDNIYNDTGWPGHVPNDNDVAYWTLGTNNPEWVKGADAVWKALMYEVSAYVAKNPATVEGGFTEADRQVANETAEMVGEIRGVYK